ncbi:MAG: hypothetical protein ABI885_16145 [Gammaproteobacteria bacterium]
MKCPLVATLLLAAVTSTAWAENRTTAGDVLGEPPTLITLGIEWAIEGDDNRNSHVALAYRKVGAARPA